MVWPCVTKSLCYAYLLVTVLHLLLPMLCIAVLVDWRHNEVHDALSFGGLASLVWSQVCREPVVKESSVIDGNADLCRYKIDGNADLCVCGVWQPQYDALFDISDAPSYGRRSPCSVRRSIYKLVLIAELISFLTGCVSIDGMLRVEPEFFLKRLSDHLAARWEYPFSIIMGWIRVRLSFAILRATMLCVRG